MGQFLKRSYDSRLVLVICLMIFAPFVDADSSKSAVSSKNYEAISLFTSATQRQSLDKLRKLTSDQAAYIVSDLNKNGSKEKKLNHDKLVFKGFIRRASVTPEIMLQTSDKNWLSKSEWQKLVEPVESGVLIKKQSNQIILKPGQAIQ